MDRKAFMETLLSFPPSLPPPSPPPPPKNLRGSLGLLHRGRRSNALRSRGRGNMVAKASQHTIHGSEVGSSLTLGKGLGGSAGLLLLVERLGLNLSLGLQTSHQVPVAPAHLVRQLAQGAEATAGLEAEDLEGLRDDHALLGVERGGDAFEGLFLRREGRREGKKRDGELMIRGQIILCVNLCIKTVTCDSRGTRSAPPFYASSSITGQSSQAHPYPTEAPPKSL